MFISMISTVFESTCMHFVAVVVLAHHTTVHYKWSKLCQPCKLFWVCSSWDAHCMHIIQSNLAKPFIHGPKVSGSNSLRGGCFKEMYNELSEGGGCLAQ